jgi:outer membrane protein assembly factor BamB
MNGSSMKKGTLAAGSALALALAGSIGAADWPQWRGPGRDGIAEGFTAPKAWPEKLRQVWSVEVGGGHASPVVAGNRVFVHSRRGEEEAVSAFALGTGKLLWRDAYRAPFQVASEASAHGPGPFATPTYHDGRLYAFGINEVLSVYDAASGKLLWRRDWGKEYAVPHPYYGTSSPPLLADGLCVVAVGGPDKGALVALDAKTGEPRWRLEGEGPGYGAAVVAAFGGVRQVVTQTQASVVGVELATGRRLWQHPFRVPYDQTILTPVVHGDRFLLSAVDTDLQAVRVSRGKAGWKTETVWSTREGTMYMSSPVLAGGRLYGFSTLRRGTLFSLDPATGKIAWKSPGGLGESAALVSAGDYLFVLLDSADLLVGKKGGGAWTQVARYDDLAASPTWAHPALLGDRLLIKDRDRLTLWHLAAPAKPAAEGRPGAP